MEQQQKKKKQQQRFRRLIDDCGKLAADDREMLDQASERYFGKKTPMSMNEHSKWTDTELDLLEDTVAGIRLTREHVPTIAQTYAKTTVLSQTSTSTSVSSSPSPSISSHSSKVSFGQMKPVRQSFPFSHYGKYAVPRGIRRLFELEAELGPEMDRRLGLIMSELDIRYPCTPPDLIPFARCGVDGIHYGFVTDFGTVDKLEEAYIAVVSPMDFGAEVWVVARGLDDFLRVVCTDNSVLYQRFDTIEAYEQNRREKQALSDDTALSEGTDRMSPSSAQKRLLAAFGIEPIADMADYLHRLRIERERSVVVPTLDGLGIMPFGVGGADGAVGADGSVGREAAEPQTEGTAGMNEEFTAEMNEGFTSEANEGVTAGQTSGERAAELLAIAEKQPELLEQAIETAGAEVVLALVRDLQYRRLFPDDPQLLRIALDALRRLQLRDEAANLLKPVE